MRDGWPIIMAILLRAGLCKQGLRVVRKYGLIQLRIPDGANSIMALCRRSVGPRAEALGTDR